MVIMTYSLTPVYDILYVDNKKLNKDAIVNIFNRAFISI